MKEAVGQRSEEALVKEHEQEGDFVALGGKPIGVALAVAFQETVSFHLTEVKTELVPAIGFGREAVGFEPNPQSDRRLYLCSRRFEQYAWEGTHE
jgi:hypothetical protein